MSKTRPIQRTVLPNGITVVVERLPQFPSVTAGVWIKRGSRNETPSLSGASHFVEHLVFKGTPTRNTAEISKTFDSMGGVLDAFTSREITGFYFRVQKAHFPKAFDVLGDMLVHPAFPPEELERERGVILEEIKMVADSPSDLMSDLFLARTYPRHPLGRPIQGTAESVSAMTRSRIIRHYRKLINPHCLVVTATGDTSLKEVKARVEADLGYLRGDPPPPVKAPVFKAGEVVFEKDHLEQAQIVAGFETEPAGGPNRHVLRVLANALGGTMSSRLFTEVREKMGLVYSIASEQSGFSDAGLFSVQAAASHANTPRTLREIARILGDVSRNGLSEEEVEIAKDNLVGGLILSMESAASRMGRLARNEVYFGRQLSARRAMESIRRVSPGQLQRVARRIFRPERGLVCVLGRPETLPKGVLSKVEGDG